MQNVISRGLLAATAGLFAIGLAATPASAGITIDQVFSSAPNAFGSPSFGGWASNALNSLQNGLGNIGDRNTDPTAYQQLTGHYAPGDAMVTSFNSWRGVANPGAPFGSELGNRLHAGVSIRGDGVVQFRLSDLTFAFHSSDSAANFFDATDCPSGAGGALCFEGNFVGFGYTGTTRIGIDYGADRTRGTADDIVYGSGNGTTLVDEIDYVGVGNAYWPGGPGDPLTGQAALDATSTYILANDVAISNQYCITGSDGVNYCDTRTLTVPEPATLALFGAGLLGLGGLRRRRDAGLAA